jgi:hypothetical protein
MFSEYFETKYFKVLSSITSLKRVKIFTRKYDR